MKINDIVFRELKQRKSRLVTSFLVIFLATAVVISLQLISDASKNAVIKQLHNLGANILVLPRTLSATDFYTADFGTADMPETYAYKLLGMGLISKQDIIAKLSHKFVLNEYQAILIGILSADKSTKLSKDIVLGNEIARLLHKKQGDQLVVKGKIFNINKVLPEKGTIDDIGIFTDLQTVQNILKKDRVINVIEIIGKPRIDTQNIIREIEMLLPYAKVITKTKLVYTQANTIQMLQKYSLLLLVVVLIVGGINIANYMLINVRERRREIGTLLAIGATPKIILKVFIQKAAMLGFAGGLIGCVFGSLLAMFAGPRIVQVQVYPNLHSCLLALVIAVIFSIISSAIPAIRAARLDPTIILQEE